MSNAFPPGSPEANKQTVELLSKFFSAKLVAIDLYQQKGVITDGTNTKSCCHIDGTDDLDDS